MNSNNGARADGERGITSSLFWEEAGAGDGRFRRSRTPFTICNVRVISDNFLRLTFRVATVQAHFLYKFYFFYPPGMIGLWSLLDPTGTQVLCKNSIVSTNTTDTGK